MFRVFLSGHLIAVFAGLCSGLLCLAQEVPKTAPPALSLNSLSMEVSALQILYRFNFTKAQMDKLQQLSVGTVQKEQKRKPGNASKDYRAKLQALNKALADAKDDDRIGKLTRELEIMGDKENPSFDDGVEITDAARKRAADAFRLLKPSQLALYIAQVADNVSDPEEWLVASLEEVRALNDEEWQDRRDEIAADISRAVVGLDPAKSKLVSDQVSALLARARTVSRAEFPKRQVDFKKAARKIVGDLAAMDVVRHQVEVELAALLSNPRLPQALRARLK
jgi:hypothetical protein